jgi:hypothetical protein
MNGIREFLVIEPPTSGEVAARVADALANQTSVVAVTLLEECEVPRPKPLAVEVSLGQLVFHRVGSGQVIRSFAGTAPGMESVRVHLSGDPEEQATASVVSAVA